MEVIAYLLPILVLILIARIIAGTLDRKRVETYVQDQGWTLVDEKWTPFGPGWLGEKNARIYRIQYRDRDGSLYGAHVKTSMLSGVYVTDPRLIRASETATDVEVASPSTSLEQENEALRQRIAELEARN